MRGWLTKNTSGKDEKCTAYCTVCESPLRSHHTDLVKHAKTQTHISNAEKYNVSKQHRLDNLGIEVQVSSEQKIADIELAVFIATHSAIRSMDHLCELLKKLGKGSCLENLKLHSTKCSKLKANVVAPVLLDELVADIGDSGFGLIIDESTEISVVKYMALMVKYHSKKKKKMRTAFLGFIEVYRATAEALFESSKEFLSSIGLNYKNCVGLGVDGASNLCGKHHSLFVLFKKEVPAIMLIRCMCHSLHGASSKAALQLPADLEFLVRETRNWFANSPLKRLQYRDLYSAINDGDMPQKLVQLVKTRWLAWSKAIDAILSQWLELKTHFQNNRLSLNPSDKCSIGRKLDELFQKESNRLYLLFLKPVTAEMNKLNLKFQATDAEVPAVFSELHESIVWLVRRFLKPAHVLSEASQERLRESLSDSSAYLPYAAVDFGVQFAVHLGTMTIRPEELSEIQSRCVKYYSVLAKQLLDSLPDHAERLQALRFFHPSECLKQTSGRPAFLDLPLPLAGSDDIDMESLKTEWDKLLLVDWGHYFGGNIPDSSIDFWLAVFDYERNGEFKFRRIAGFALRALSLPFLNAVVERLFSMMNAVKVKARNRMKMAMLVAILRIRTFVQEDGGCCHTFVPTQDMLDLFSSDMYEMKEAQQQSEGDEDEDGDVVGDDLVESLCLLADDDDDCWVIDA